MILQIEDTLIKDLTIEEAELDLAIGLFIDNKITLGQGAVISHLSQL